MCEVANRRGFAPVGGARAGPAAAILETPGCVPPAYRFQPRWWPGDQGGIERVGGDLFHQLSGWPVDKSSTTSGHWACSCASGWGSARCSRTFHGAQAQASTRLLRAHGLAGLFGQGQQAVGITAQGFAGR